MSRITTHVLDTARGRPAAGVAVTLEAQSGSGWREVARGRTDVDGRLQDLGSGSKGHPTGTYRLRFAVGDYFADHGTAAFYPYVEVVFTANQGEHYHVPLLVSPFGYTTYRGS